MTISPLRAALLALLGLFLAAPAKATWSIVVINRETGELAVATSTCISNFDIATAVPVIRVGYAAGAAQSAVIGQATNRRRIFRNSLRGATPQQMLDVIEASDGGFEVRQFGIVAFSGPPVTHTGTSNGAFADGLTGSFGPYEYAIQGNVLTGANVVFDCEAAFVNTPGDLGQRIVAAMEAARDAGGDGRCSCTVGAPTGCGSPPPSFTYASYNAFMAIARLGDTDALCLGSTGCAAGDYYLRITYAGNQNTQEPIARLRAEYDAWRASQVGRPDHVLSEYTTSVPRLQADGVTSSRVEVQLRDIDGNPLAVGGQSVTAVRLSGPPVAQAVNVVDNGDGTHSLDLRSTLNQGTSTYAIVVDDGIRPVQLYPTLTVESAAPAELHIGQGALSAAEGTPLPLILDRGAADAGASYRVLASLSGTQPGTVVGGVSVPLNRDRLLDFTAGWPGGAPFTGNAGALDPDGRAQALLALDPGSLLPFVGATMSFSAVIGGAAATPPASILVGP
ncbi:MAG: DUF1028 domain-containing protein [Planctomycetota bacterium]|jgi:hypothetical protein